MRRLVIGAATVVAVGWGRLGWADPPVPGKATGCAATLLDDQAVVTCALRGSPEVEEVRSQLATARARHQTAEVVLPGNPTISGTLSRRRRPAPESATVLNWNVTVSQEVEIAGQRGLRIDAAETEVSARARRVAVAEQEVAAGALTAFYQAIAAQEALHFTGELTATAQALATFAQERARAALVAGIEANVARADAARLGLAGLEAQRRVAETRAALAVLLDLADAQSLRLPARLPAWSADDAASAGWEDQALRLRGEIAAATLERRVLEQRLALVRRERIPNLTFSAFAERGEINDRIIGLGLSVPIPLPAPLGRTRAGEIAEAVAGLRAAESSHELVRRRVRLEVARAAAAVQSRRDAAALLPPDLLERAHADLLALREAVAGHQLSLREALQWQRSLIELLQADIDVRLGRTLAWIELQRVVGLPLTPARESRP
jgi:cobalt-zinc-cadmium efflux system outer membrane protein